MIFQILRLECQHMDIINLLPNEELLLSKKWIIEAEAEKERKKSIIADSLRHVKIVVMVG